MNRTVTPASAKQAAFVNRLAAEKAGAADVIAAAFIATLSGDVTDMTTREASDLIDALIRLPRKTTDTPTTSPDVAPLTPGLYVHDGDTYKVQASRESGNLYAKVLVRESADEVGFWSYAPGAIRALATARRLTLDEAAAYGRATGTCMVCGRTLTDPDSVSAGIGPVCASRM